LEHLITDLTTYDHKRCKVTLDEGEVAFLLYNGECRKLRLKAGDALSEEDYGQIQKEILLPRAKKRLLYYLRGGDKSAMQLKKKLRDGLYPEDVISEALAFLERYDFMNDERLGRDLIESYGKRKSVRELEQKLCEKGISRELARRLLEEAEPDEAEACRRVLRSYLKGKPASAYTEKGLRKAGAYLMRKGYGYEQVREALEACMQEDDNGGGL